MKKKLPFEWVRAIKKLMDHLIAADNFGIFLSLVLGKPEQLSG
jgi:proteic killer suppression protein